MSKTGIVVKLVGTDGNAFAILGKVRETLMKAGLRQEADDYMNAARAGDYNHLIKTTMEWVDVE
jgi:hypothetical protein